MMEFLRHKFLHRETLRRQSEGQETVRKFHIWWYESKVWKRGVTWEGTEILKNPMDLWMYQQVIFSTCPDLIIETGSYRGGSALYFARLLEILGDGSVLSVDLNPIVDGPSHPRLEFVTGSSTSEEVVGQLTQRALGAKRVMVVLDSDHSALHVAEELRVLSPLVSPGCYLVVEDTNVNGHPARPTHGPGPMEALQQFLASGRDDFLPDKDCERYALTFNPSGWLRRVKA